MKIGKSKKELLSLVTCGGTFLFGWGLTIAGFIVPPVGIVSESVLFILGLSLLYCGAILGISEHYAAKLKDFENEIKSKLEK